MSITDYTTGYWTPTATTPDCTRTTYAGTTAATDMTNFETTVRSALENYLFQPLTQGTLSALSADIGTAVANTDYSTYRLNTWIDNTTDTMHCRWWNTTDSVYYGYSRTIPWMYDTATDITGWAVYPCAKISKKDELKQKIENNLFIRVKSRASLVKGVSKAEAQAMETLREEISESEFRKYIKYGFILVRGQSGKTYQVFRNRSHTKVWLGGKLIEEVCVRISDSKIPETDNVIAFKAMIEADEEEFAKMGNRYKFDKVAAAA